MFGLGPREVLILIAILILLFGSKKIADLARSVAEGIKVLRGSFSDEVKTDETNKTDKNA
jgi:TatA/E family protein of Tat protein translocase